MKIEDYNKNLIFFWRNSQIKIALESMNNKVSRMKNLLRTLNFTADSICVKYIAILNELRTTKPRPTLPLVRAGLRRGWLLKYDRYRNLVRSVPHSPEKRSSSQKREIRKIVNGTVLEWNAIIYDQPRILATSSPIVIGSKGLVITPAIPIWAKRARSLGKTLAVSTTTGIARLAWFAWSSS